MAWRIAFVLWSGADELGINCYYLVNQKGRAMIAYGDDELYTIRSRIDNYNINKPRGAKDVYTPVKYYRKASFETISLPTAKRLLQKTAFKLCRSDPLKGVIPQKSPAAVFPIS